MKKILALILVVCLIASCTGFGRNPNPANTDFYKGTQGVNARFDYLPSTFYYYRDPGYEENNFEVGVEIHNEGASWARGAVFLSGYDPNIVYFDEVPIGGQQLGSCGFSLGVLGAGEFAGLFSCDGAYGGVNTLGDVFLNIDSFKKFTEGMGWSSNLPDFSVKAENVYDQTHFTLNFLDPNIDMEYWGHGRLFISMFSGIDFLSVLGREYVLAGRSYEYPSGDMEFMMYNGRIRDSGWSPGLDKTTQPLLLTNCYFYTTFAAPLVCIDPDPYSDVRKVCQPRQLSFSGSQGAPVAITAIEQNANPRRSQFQIHIQNVGRGEVFDAGQMQKCSPYIADRVSPNDKNIIYVGDIRIGNQRLTECTPEGFIRLDQNGRGTITCTYPYEYIGIQSAYETPLYVELWYGYVDTELRQMQIKRFS